MENEEKEIIVNMSYLFLGIINTECSFPLAAVFPPVLVSSLHGKMAADSKTM